MNREYKLSTAGHLNVTGYLRDSYERRIQIGFHSGAASFHNADRLFVSFNKNPTTHKLITEVKTVMVANKCFSFCINIKGSDCSVRETVVKRDTSRWLHGESNHEPVNLEARAFTARPRGLAAGNLD